jgi:hypothetical protein
MALYTENYLKSQGLKAELRLHKSASTVLKEYFSAVKSEQYYDIFLSHSIKDQDVIVGLAQDFIEQGLKVYVDWLEDPQLDRTQVTKDTAEVLRCRMKTSKCLIYAYSGNSPSSKWMPWELGYFDGINGRVAVLEIIPQINPNAKYMGQEYLGLYPYIDRVENAGLTSNIFVNNRLGQWSLLKYWMQGIPIPTK